MFHSHGPWIEVSTHYTPQIDIERVRGVAKTETLLLIMGNYTVVYLKCEGCRDIKSRIVPGKYEGEKT